MSWYLVFMCSSRLWRRPELTSHRKRRFGDESSVTASRRERCSDRMQRTLLTVRKRKVA